MLEQKKNLNEIIFVIFPIFLINTHLHIIIIFSGTGTPNTGGSAQAATGDDCQCGQGLLHPYLILGLIIWLLILTLIVIMLIVLLTRRHNEYTRSQGSVRTLPRDSGGPFIVDGRSDTWKEYTLASDRMSERYN